MAVRAWRVVPPGTVGSKRYVCVRLFSERSDVKLPCQPRQGLLCWHRGAALPPRVIASSARRISPPGRFPPPQTITVFGLISEPHQRATSKPHRRAFVVLLSKSAF